MVYMQIVSGSEEQGLPTADRRVVLVSFLVIYMWTSLGRTDSSVVAEISRTAEGVVVLDVTEHLHKA